MEMNIVLERLKSEMKPSMGCTEPVAIGLAVSRTCELLSKPATHLDMTISSNIFKNAYSVQIPNTGTNGIELSCALGHLLSKQGNTMEIFAEIHPEQVEEAKKLVNQGFVSVTVLPSSEFFIECVATNEEEKGRTITENAHENMILAEINGQIVVDKRTLNVLGEREYTFDITKYTFKDFYDWANIVDVADLAFIKEGIDMNLAIADLGMKKKYAIGVGATLKKLADSGKISNDMITDIKQLAAAASDFRMSGGNGSVMTFLGSGNQGIETMVPMAVFAKHMDIPEEKLLRGEFLGMLIIMYMKHHIGRLSPICGATLAGAGGAAGMVYMMDGNINQISGAVQNMMGGVAGMFCDGAKGGCSLKLSICAGEAVYSALFALDDSIIQATDGIISKQAEETTKSLAKLSHEGLAHVDMKVIEIMQSKS
ncbi:L-cysteine desulfidase family protein [Anaerotignum sp. MB30-C6]|uniref:L-cysteine desulfidase family protein n=1 Tax=Anaerotignum sp. MB30-C6 TaxID=3070814 RepID=UPI0027DC71FF|nr:L-serine ammonia-lyase, iron-sulfur-dependent, subunit alpha [Anaerotignum sp. MB30-C6]WMI82218.1 L-serine ammonia-lyase, iron-sulfur-dependent, subunit alpha [Anaerotignum sp. MB30-C6]